MPVLNEDDGAAADDADSRQRCSCLPFCFWGASNKSGGAQVKRRRRRRLRLRLRLRLSWLAWPWFRKGGNGDDNAGGDGSSDKGKKKRRKGGRRLLLLLTTSLQPKKALASVVSGDSALLPVPGKVSSYGDAKKKTQSNRRPRRATADDDDAASGSRQPPASATAATTSSTGWATAPARSSRPETTSQAPSPRPTDGPGASGRITWRAPSRRHSLRQPGPGDCSSGGGGLWTAATTLGVIVLLGRVAAVVFLCSCLYGARFVRAWAAGGAGAGASASSKALQLSRGSVSRSSRRFGDPVGVAAGDKAVAEMGATDTECKKKVVMAGLLDRAGKTPSSCFGR